MASIKGHGEKASRKREIFIAYLLTEPNIREAAKKAGIGENTGWRWLQDPVFKEAYQEARRAAVSQAIAQLQQASTEAVTTLRKVMADQDATPSSRVTAAKTTLEMALKSVELEDLAQRIQKLEQSLQNHGRRQACL
jgi:predicted negative regulator of RcsB-dependent stress response